MRNARVRTIIILVFTFALLFVVSLHFKQREFYRFPGISGPSTPSKLQPIPYAQVQDFDKGSVHRLAILVTDPESGWLGLARGLKAHGVPFTMTRSVSEALQHKVVMVYPVISGRVLSAPDLHALEGHVRDGGFLLATDVEGGISDTFGVLGAEHSRKPQDLRWLQPRGAPEENTLRINKPGSEASMGITLHHVTTATVLARFDDNSPAVACQGAQARACFLAVDLGDLSERAMNGRAEPLARAYVNHYEPTLDELYRWVSDFYVRGEPSPWLIGTTPAGHEVSIILSHDIDFTRSVRNSKVYADMIASKGLSATFFMQTKYIRDYNDDVFFNKANIPDLKYVLGKGMEIGSHTVSHSRVFKGYPVGDGAEHYPDYRPFVQGRTQAVGGTVFGETRVSKYLLETLVGAKITSFRAGHLSFPFKLPDVLAAEGYDYDSSITADTCLTHLPFQLSKSRADESLEPVYEFPVTIEDEEAPKLGDRFDAANDVVSKIATRGGVAVFLIHPDVTDHKLAFEQRLIDQWRDRAWIGSMRQFGDWWRARDLADVDLQSEGDGEHLVINAPRTVDGLVIRFPKASRGHPKQVVVSGVTGQSTRSL